MNTTKATTKGTSKYSKAREVKVISKIVLLVAGLNSHGSVTAQEELLRRLLLLADQKEQPSE